MMWTRQQAEQAGIRLTPSSLSTRHARRNKYNEWVHCLKTNEKEESKCYLPRFNMRELCPVEWVSDSGRMS